MDVWKTRLLSLLTSVTFTTGSAGSLLSARVASIILNPDRWMAVTCEAELQSGLHVTHN